ncbi:MAG: carbonic anhydrase [Gomphosphaeria aponina SAG 52.96 = DSM 107014]|uniref:Carbonic anhydrase n=1 Tax=Gomphosphaeria aponina SAG 52.96 = DSM 107014 TaxID=1521640 RepID=A0A941GT62_9CHRO|nr:carbonic anhydrase [Gomphosphaeria aponina SAG 52.96 = DSM 107014]
MKKLIDGLQKFQTGYYSSHKELFEELSHGQQPRILFITCSDSRIDPNLITQAEVGELFVIRNAGNIIPPFGATNGGEGAAVEYAIHHLEIEQVIVCGHSHCGAMKGLLKLESLAAEMPLVYEWLKQAEATRRLVKDNYGDFEGMELLELTVAENVLNQLENLHTYPVIRSKVRQGKLALHGWIYRIESGEVLAYDPVVHDFVFPHSRLSLPEHEYSLHGNNFIRHHSPFTVDHESIPSSPPRVKEEYADNPRLPVGSHISLEQKQRIYQGSNGYK